MSSKIEKSVLAIVRYKIYVRRVNCSDQSKGTYLVAKLVLKAQEGIGGGHTYVFGGWLRLFGSWPNVRAFASGNQRSSQSSLGCEIV